MGNYNSACRTNNFEVRNEIDFVNQMSNINSIKVVKECSGFSITADGGWPQISQNKSLNNVDITIDFPHLVSRYLIDGEVAVFMEIGLEKYNNKGVVLVINNKGERKSGKLIEVHCLIDTIKEARL